MADRDEVGAAPDRIGKPRSVESGLGVGIGIALQVSLYTGSATALRTGFCARR